MVFVHPLSPFDSSFVKPSFSSCLPLVWYYQGDQRVKHGAILSSDWFEIGISEEVPNADPRSGQNGR